MKVFRSVWLKIGKDIPTGQKVGPVSVCGGVCIFTMLGFPIIVSHDLS